MIMPPRLIVFVLMAMFAAGLAVPSGAAAATHSKAKAKPTAIHHAGRPGGRRRRPASTPRRRMR